jgi:hypothetical protein
LNGSIVIFTNENPAYAAGIAYDDTYRTIGVSFEFGGLADGADSKNDLMGQIIDFFDNGCAGGKPAPMNVVAFGDYDNAVPIVWDAPPGQSTLSATDKLEPTLTTSREFISRLKRNTVVGRQRQSSNTFTSLSKTSAVGYQADSYNIYRSTSENSGYSQIASNVDRNYYRDESASNGTTYYYVVKGVYDGAEGDASLTTSAQPAPTNSAVSTWEFINPNINGHLDTDEWTNAASINITASGQTNSATLYFFNNENYLYLAIDDPANTALNTDDQVGFNFDKNLDYNWPGSSLTDEGTLWFSWGSALSTLFRGLNGHWPVGLDWADPTSASGISSAVSTSSGHVQYEMKIDLNNSVLNAALGETIGLYLYSLDMPDSTFTASWPNAVLDALWSDAWMIPVMYGTLDIALPAPQPDAIDVESVSAPATVTFNEYGDGHAVTMEFINVTGQGNVTVTQTNNAMHDPINNDYIDCIWEFEKDPGITSFETNITFSYTDADVAGFDETKLIVHLWTGSHWQYEGGTVDPLNNTITLKTNGPGQYALFARDHVKVSVSALLQGAYDTNGMMTANLAAGGHLPFTSPYADARLVEVIPQDVTDWISIELRSSENGGAIAQRSFFLKKENPAIECNSRETVLHLPDATDGSFYVVIKHRNHMLAMSATALSLSRDSATTLDLTTLASIYGGDAKALETGIYALYAGDANGNGHIQNDDKNDFWKIQNGTAGYLSGDFNLDGQVNNNDLNLWQPNAGRGTRVP